MAYVTPEDANVERALSDMRLSVPDYMVGALACRSSSAVAAHVCLCCCFEQLVLSKSPVEQQEAMPA